MFQQIETLIEGKNPHAADALGDLETRRARAALGGTENAVAFVRGRVTGAGAALWPLTQRRLLVVAMGVGEASRSVEFDHITSLEACSGRYGVTLGLHAQGRRAGLFAADRGLSVSFGAALAQAVPSLGVQSSLDPLAADEAAEVGGQLVAARARLPPSASQTVVQLREAAALHERGVLDTAQSGLLKDRLLAAA